MSSSTFGHSFIRARMMKTGNKNNTGALFRILNHTAPQTFSIFYSVGADSLSTYGN